ncbi:hypothetical protein HCZ30_10805 [Marivivens donghaensis]|uniref:Uncharacterized protein n=1 Tax=Marivivens donghaensis TaxID=1699413 RepID=A0ABX0VYT8_9RHOB|nr:MULTISPECIES: DUF6477 family protein [Marivivens]NIY72918.1 hypothetical protein [Marivivens donghaensis]
MFDILGMVSTLKRPSLLVRSARHGVADYCRDRHLPRLLKRNTAPRHGEALMRLMEMEADLNEQRLGDRAAYSFASHIEVLIAIMAEARLLTAAREARGV